MKSTALGAENIIFISDAALVNIFWTQNHKNYSVTA